MKDLIVFTGIEILSNDFENNEVQSKFKEQCQILFISTKKFKIPSAHMDLLENIKKNFNNKSTRVNKTSTSKVSTKISRQNDEEKEYFTEKNIDRLQVILKNVFTSDTKLPDPPENFQIAKVSNKIWELVCPLCQNSKINIHLQDSGGYLRFNKGNYESHLTTHHRKSANGNQQRKLQKFFSPVQVQSIHLVNSEVNLLCILF